jgi:hydrogenase maturation protein HypF
MFPQSGADGLDVVRRAVQPREQEAAVVADPKRPIVLVRKSADCALSPLLAPGLSELGVFLPYSPLHHLLLGDFGAPLVATSGNVSGEPVLTDNTDAEQRLSEIADGFLHHDRPIVRPADDTVIRVIGGTPRMIRPGRGVTPLEIELPEALPHPVLAVGGHMKATVALGWGRRAVLSPHIGELASVRSLGVFEQVIADLQALYGVDAEAIACDAHPGYASTRWARGQGLPVLEVQHHTAHASALAGEYPEVPRWLVFAWDGVGYGADGTLWGGEAFAGSPGDWRRVGSVRPFRVAGGDRVAREPWRSAAALHWETGAEIDAEIAEIDMVRQAWDKGINTQATSSVGRLFDAASSIVLGINAASFEGHGPMMFESLARDGVEAIALPLIEDGDGLVRIDWEPLLPMMRNQRLAPAERASAFHESLARALVAQVGRIAERENVDVVGLTGGVFQNRLFGERVIRLLQDRSIPVKMPSRIPANDGGLAFGQLVEFLYSCGKNPDESQAGNRWP